MIGKKPLAEIRADLLSECARAGIDPLVWFDQQIQRRERRGAADPVEMETLRLIRDGLKSEAAKPARKRVRKEGK